MAGFFVLLSLSLGYWVSPYWFLFTAFVGLNLLQSGFTNWCPAMWFFKKLGLRQAVAAPAIRRIHLQWQRDNEDDPAIECRQSTLEVPSLRLGRPKQE